jgi:hypothetical protein
MSDKRLFVASSELFSNYQKEISLYNVSTIDDIIKIFVSSLKDILQENNLISLSKKLDQTKFHIHNTTIEDILISDKESIFYICDHVD